MKKAIIILILLSGLLFFFKLGSFSLYDAAETTYGEFIKQIRLTGDWVTMHYNGEILFDKPPLYFWLATGATYIFGFSEFAIRFWAALCGVLTVLTTFFMGKTLYNQRTGFLSAIAAMTTFQFLVQSRIAELDILLTLFMVLSLFLFYLGYRSGNKKYYMISGLPMGLAILVKGLIGLAIPALAIFLFLSFKKEFRKMLDIQIALGILIALLIGLPWYIAEYLLHGKAFLDFALGFLFLSRFGGVVSGHTGPWYYYFLALILGFAPWSQFLPFSLWRTWKHRTHDPELLTLCYIIPVFIVFSIAKTKLPNYILPLYPLLAITVGKLWDDLLRNGKAMLKGMAISQVLLAVVIILIMIGVVIAGKNYSGPYQAMIPNLLILAGILMAGGSASIILYFFRSYDLSFAAIPAMVFCLTFILTTLTLPAIENYKGEKELGMKVAESIKANETISAYNVGNRPGVVFYNSKPVKFIDNLKERGYIFTTLDEYEKIKHSKPGIFAQKGDMVVVYNP